MSDRDKLKIILWQLWIAIMLTLMLDSDFCIIDGAFRIKPGREFLVGGSIFVFLLASVREKLK